MVYQSLKGVGDIFEQTLNNELQDNIVEFLDWGLLEKGNYFNVTKDEISPNGSDYSLLKPVKHPYYQDGTVWEGFRKNWVWQSGIGYDPEPMVGLDSNYPGISGLYFDDTYYQRDLSSDSSSPSSFDVDYFNGRIIFKQPQDTNTKVQIEHSYKYINVVYSNALPWIREIQYRDNEPSTNQNEIDILPEMKLQLPAIAVEIVPRRTFRGYQLGGGQYVYTDVLFHCIAEDEITRNKLVDIVSLQNDKTISMFDSNKISDSGAFPLTSAGFPVANASRYPDLINNYPGKSLRFQNAIVQGMELINSNFYAGVVRITTEVINTSI